MPPVKREAPPFRAGEEVTNYPEQESNPIREKLRLQPPPCHVGQDLVLDVVDTAPKGDGLAFISGFAVFVAGAKPGQKVNARIIKVSARFAIAAVVSPADAG